MGYNLPEEPWLMFVEPGHQGYVRFDGFIPYAITDSTYSSECDDIFGSAVQFDGYGQYWRDVNICENGTEHKTKMGCVARFLDDVLAHENVRAILFETSLKHGYPSETVTRRTIRAGELLREFEKAPTDGYSVPAVQFMIEK